MNSRRIIATGTALTIAIAAAATAWMVRGESRADPQQRFEQAVEAARSEDWSTVAAITRELATRPEFESHTALLLGLRLAADGHFETALRSFKRATDNPETALPALVGAGRTLYLLQRYRESIAVLKRAVALDAEHDEAHRFLASAYYDIGAMDDAQKVLDAIIRFAPDDFRAYRFKAMILHDFELYDDALIQWNAAIERAKLDPKFLAYCQFRKGECLIRLRRYDEACVTLAEVRLDPAGSAADGLPAADFAAQVLAARAEACLAIRRFDDSSRFASESLSLTPGNVAATLTAVRLAEEQQQNNDAILLLKTAIERHPFEAQLFGRMADILATTGQTEQAAVARSRSAELMKLQTHFAELHQQAIARPEDFAVRLRLAETAESLGRAGIAGMWYQAASGLAPQDAAVQQALQAFRRRQQSGVPGGAAP
ncbi:MAG: tetratricopeptide repeat protein [Fuerstia sp.]|nr:tetratricopeptide repeat protein [Fuerstiella sp.]